MARGYLGKISAIVSANTGDYVRKLDDSARRTRAFAKTIQSDLDRASKQSTRAINDILTPLQRLERAIQNASSARLKFNGVDTAISNVKQLQAAVSRLEGTNIDVAVRASGLRTITELKQQLQQLQQDDVDLFVNLVGANGTVADLRRIRETYQEIDGKTVSTDVRVKADVAQVDRLIQLFGTLSKQRLDAVVRVVGERQVEQAARSMRQLASVANELAAPLGRAAQQLGGMTNEIQVAFGPAIQRAQRGVLNLQDDIERGANISEQRYAGVARAVDRVTAAVSRLTEAQSLANSGQTGQELAFRAPRVRDELSQSAALSQQASQLPAATLADDSIRQRVEDLARLRQEIARYQTSVEKRQVLGLDTTEASARLAAAIRQSAEVRGSLEQTIKVFVDTQEAERKAKELNRVVASLRENAAFVITGRAQNIDQVKSELQDVLTSIGRLKDDARGDLQVQVDAVINAIDANDFDEARNAVEQLRASAGNAITLDADTQAAEEKTKRLRDSIEAVRQRVEFSITGNPQTFEQARQQFNAIFADFEKLSEASKRSIAVDITRVGELIEEGQEGELANIVALLQRVKNEVDGLKGRGLDLDFGRDLNDPRRSLEVLKGSVVSLKGQLDTLPASIRNQFLPAIEAAEANLRKLATVGATAFDLNSAAAQIDQLTRKLRQVSQVQAIPNFAEAFEGSALRGAIGNLQAFQQIIARVGVTAGSEAAVQFDRMRAAVLRAANDGTLGTRAFAQELERLTNEAAEALAATGRIGSAAAFREIQRGGDIARGGFNNLSLAAQQAAFAIDDFFSVQGDFTQRLRAVQNNVTQLAFIIGGTRGLFIGLGVAIAAQATVALINWINNGRTAEDQTKAINDALARQKSLVEELAQAFESLGDSIARRAFSDSAQEARAFRKELDDIAKKQRELNEARVADLDVDVQRERAQQNQIRRDLESEDDPGARVALQRRLVQSQEREQAAARAAVERRVTGDDVAAAISRSILNAGRASLGGRTGEARAAAERELQRRADEAAGNIARGDDPASILAQRRALQSRIDELLPVVDNFSSLTNPGRAARQEVASLQQVLNSLEAPINEALNQLSRNIIQSSLGAALAIEQAQNDVADAIQRGVAGAADFQAALDNTARQLEEEERRLADAQNIRDPAERERQIRIAEGNIRDIRNRQDVINEQSRELRLTTGRGGERTTAALSALQGNERFANEYGRLTARLRDAADREFAARNALAQATAEGDEAAKARARAELDAANAASDLAAAAAEAALAMEKALSRIRKIGDDALSASTSIADEAQRRFTQDPTEANRRDRDAAERQLIQDRERVARANNALDRARSEAESSDPRIRAINDEIRAIQDERTRIGDLSAQDRTPEDARRAEELANREVQLQAERAQRLNELTQAERAQQDAIAQEIDSRRRLIEQIERERAFDEQVARRRDPQGDAVRGLDLFDTPAQRAAREAEQGILDIAAAFGEQIRGLLDANGGLPNADILAQSDELRRQRDQAAAQFAEQQQRAAAPAIFNLADSVQNAILQGPSRAALNVSDISTQEGARELNRLLRGEDSARDQNLVELQKQSQELQLVNQRLTEVARQVGVAL